MSREATRIELNSLDYPFGLTVFVNNFAVYSFEPHPPAAIDGTGWAEAAFDPEPVRVQPSWADLGYVRNSGAWVRGLDGSKDLPRW